jgi:hypothetical protein
LALHAKFNEAVMREKAHDQRPVAETGDGP